MAATIVVGAIFFGLVGLGAYKSYQSMRNNKCPGCSGGCSEQAKQACSVKQLK